MQGVAQIQAEPVATARPRCRKASWALGLAIGGALLGGFYVPILFSLAAVIQGIRALREIRANRELKGKRLAIAAIVLGTLGPLFWALLTVAMLAAASGGGGAAMFA